MEGHRLSSGSVANSSEVETLGTKFKILECAGYRHMAVCLVVINRL